MKKLMPMRAALESPDIFGKVFAGESWAKWRVLLIAIFGEELTAAERVVFKALTDREREPLEPVDEAWNVVGRRSGKTRAMAIAGAYVAALCDHSDTLAPGERAILPIISASVYQAGKALQYLNGIFDSVPALTPLVESRTADTISLSTRVDIECRPASFRTIRSGAAVAVIGDEVAFWRSDDSANPDTEILNAARPLLLTTNGVMLIISSPYARRGEVFLTHERDFGAKGDPLILVAKAASQVMNPTLPAKFIARAFLRDPASAAAEYGSIEDGIRFRSDIESFISRDAVTACVSSGVFERGCVEGLSYFGFFDGAGGSGPDSMTYAVAHSEGGKAVLDCVREVQPPFSPEAGVIEAVALFKTYRIYSVKGDRWGGDWPREQFRKLGIFYEPSELSKSEIYLELLPAINSGAVDLLDDDRLISQVCGLERRTTRGSRDIVDHAGGSHDDRINAAAGALWAARGVSAPAILVFYRDRLVEAEGKPAPAAPKLDPLPWRRAPKPPESPPKTAAASTREKTLAALAPKPPLCETCGLPVVGTRQTDGFHVWHTTCV